MQIISNLHYIQKLMFPLLSHSFAELGQIMTISPVFLWCRHWKFHKILSLSLLNQELTVFKYCRYFSFFFEIFSLLSYG